MASTCYSSIQGLAMRATRLSGCGAPVTSGATNKAVSEGFVSIGLTAQYQDGVDYTTRTASGKLCVSDKGARHLTRYDLVMAFCSVDPELFELCGGVRLVPDYAGKSVGFAVDRDPTLGGFAIEIWTKVPNSPTAPCDASGAGNYLYWLLPYCAFGSVENFTIDDATASFTINCGTKYGNLWGTGPYDVVPTDNAGTPGKLAGTGVLTSEHLLQRVTSIAPPVGACGYVP